MACFKEAVEVGYEDFDHARKDGDLEALRALPVFQELVGADGPE